MSYKIGILRNENPFDHELWVKACHNNKLVSEYDVIDITKDDWYNNLHNKDYDLILLRPPGRSELFKKLYDERAFLIHNYFKKIVYPSLEEIFIYENKRFLRDWLLCTDIPHPNTFISFYLEEAKTFIRDNNEFPIVAKTSIGSSGNGVQILKNRDEAISYCEKAFSDGIKPSTGPHFKKGNLFKKLHKAMKNKGFINQRIKDYLKTGDTIQKGFVILQNFIPHEYEWRCVRIGNSYFAHKKIAINNKSSGTLVKGYDTVPVSLLNFIKYITCTAKLSSVAIDVFEKDNYFIVNEIQCFFGQSDPYQMLVDGKPGRYKFTKNNWFFEAGDFNKNESYDLRLEHAVSLIEENRL